MRISKALWPKKRKQDSHFKHWIRLFHLWLGLLSSLVILIVCFTGCLYAFKNQINDLYNRKQLFVQVENQPTAIQYFEDQFLQENKIIQSIILPEQNNRSWLITTKNIHTQQLQTHYYNPYNGKNLGQTKEHWIGFFQTIEALHKNLMWGKIGQQIVGAFVLVFILLIFTGLILWFPKNKKRQIKQAFSIKWNGKFHRLNYDLHNTLGFYSWVFLLFIAITGVYITYPWVKTAVLVSLGGESIQQQIKLEDEGVSTDFHSIMKDLLDKQNEKFALPQSTQIPLSQILNWVQKELPYKGTTIISMPNENNPRYQIQKIKTTKWLGLQLPDFLEIDRNGTTKRKELFHTKPLHQQFKELSKPLHTGEIMGWKGAILYFIITLIGFSLPITGFIIWWRKVK